MRRLHYQDYMARIDDSRVCTFSELTKVRVVCLSLTKNFMIAIRNCIESLTLRRISRLQLLIKTEFMEIDPEMD